MEEFKPKPVAEARKEEAANVEIPTQLTGVAEYLQETVAAAIKDANPDPETVQRRAERRQHYEQLDDLDEEMKDMFRDIEIEGISAAAKRKRDCIEVNDAFLKGSYEPVIAFLDKELLNWKEFSETTLAELNEEPSESMLSHTNRIQIARNELAAYISEQKAKEN